MDGLTSARLIIIAAGIVVWGYGLQSDNATLRIVGMSLLAVALVLRFFRRKRRGNGDPAEPK